MPEATTRSAQLVGVTLDCPDPTVMAEFYGRLCGLERSLEQEDLIVVGTGSVRLGFVRIPDHRPPGWPSPTKQLHLDFVVDDLDDAEAIVLSGGGAKPDFQPGGDRWSVYLDPAGHPFCLST